MLFLRSNSQIIDTFQSFQDLVSNVFITNFVWMPHVQIEAVHIGKKIIKQFDYNAGIPGRGDVFDESVILLNSRISRCLTLRNRFRHYHEFIAAALYHHRVVDPVFLLRDAPGFAQSLVHANVPGGLFVFFDNVSDHLAQLIIRVVKDKGAYLKLRWESATPNCRMTLS